jgi:hypothetical protein
VVETRTIVFCPTCRVFWGADGEATCVDAAHVESYGHFEGHVHRDEVALSDGTVVVAVTFDERDPYSRPVVPDFGLYLDNRWQPPWPHAHVDWPDFGVPNDSEAVVAALSDVLARARSGQRVEVGCWGAHGRTGTALACLAVLTGCPPPDAVAWVRAAYCDQAVETPEQADFVTTLRH